MAEEKKNTGKPKTSMFALVQAGKEEAKKVQSIKSVSSQQTSEEKIPEVQPAASTTEPAKVVAPVQEEEIIQENENMTEEPSEFPESSFPKGLSLLFAKREIIDTETIKIPREFHQELKILKRIHTIGFRCFCNRIQDCTCLCSFLGVYDVPAVFPHTEFFDAAFRVIVIQRNNR